jgi:SAM-dependent methyltransferase
MSVFSSTLKNLGRKLPARAESVLARWRGNCAPASAGCEIVEGNLSAGFLNGWKNEEVARAQHAAFVPLLRAMREGKPREDFIAVAAAVQTTALKDPSVIEVGCGSGWNLEVLRHLLESSIHYVGLDYSPAMVAYGKQHSPDTEFVVGDALALPFKSAACDILLSGTVLMHLLGYREAIAESRRVTRQWCIFHTVPTVKNRPTTALKKLAYGSPVVEIVLNIEELSQLIEENGFWLRQTFDNIPHDYLNTLLGEHVSVQTYLCEVKCSEPAKPRNW